jgi:hypothetical protein
VAVNNDYVVVVSVKMTLRVEEVRRFLKERLPIFKEEHSGQAKFPYYTTAAPTNPTARERIKVSTAPSHSPLERGASSPFFKSLEEAGCVARKSVL